MSDFERLKYTDAENEIRSRLLKALHNESLLSPDVADGFKPAQLAQSNVPPAELLRQLAEHDCLKVPATNIDRACAEIEDSVTGLYRARHGINARWGNAPQATPGRGYSDLVAQLRSRCTHEGRTPSELLAKCEQIVCDGHPAHPAAKTSLGIGDFWKEVLPEQTETIELYFIAVESSKIVSTGLSVKEALSAQLPQLSAKISAELSRKGWTDREIIPVHPFQWKNVIEEEFAQEIADGHISLLQTTGTAEPLMSVRTVRLSDGAGSIHIKLALEVQLTGAIRGISAGAVLAPQISEALENILHLDTGFNPRTNDDEPGFAIARDIAAVRWRSDSGIRAHCLGAVFRKDPAAQARADDVVMPVATLIAANPLTGRPVLRDVLEELGGDGDTAVEWFDALAQLLFVPSLALIARWGISLEPHPQNTVVVLRNGWPHRVIVRDFGGCRIWEHGAAAESIEFLESVKGTALIEEDLLRVVDKTFYPLVANLYRNLLDAAGISAATETRISKVLSERISDEYWRTRASHLDLNENSGEVAFRRILGTEMPVKRVLGMRLSGAVTEQDYVLEPNPLAGHELLSVESLQRKVVPHSQWAGDCLRQRVTTAAVDEGLAESQLLTLDEEMTNAKQNLSLVRFQVEQRIHPTFESYWDLLRGLPAHEATLAADSLVISGHNVHPLAKLRKGFSLEESIAYGPENGAPVDLRLLAVEQSLVSVSTTADFSELLELHFPGHVHRAHQFLTSQGLNTNSYRVIPVHPWQLRHVVESAFGQEIAQSDIVVIPQLTLAAKPTISLRTLIPHAPSALGQHPYIKCAVDVVLTSTRRSISPHSALGTPRVAGIVAEGLKQLRDEIGLSARVEVVPELTGIALTPVASPEDAELDATAQKTRQRGLSALLRADSASLLEPGEVAVSACALRGHEEILPSPLRDLSLEFLESYVSDLMETVLGLMFFKGIALEQHLQNTMVRFDISGDVPEYRGLLLRDFSGLRAWSPRLQSWCSADAFEPGAVTLTHDFEEFLNKGFYASVFGNLEGIIDEYAKAHSLDPAELWRITGDIVRKFVDRLRNTVPDQDARWINRKTIRRKGFLSMGMTETGADIYFDVQNPLAVHA